MGEKALDGVRLLVKLSHTINHFTAFCFRFQIEAHEMSTEANKTYPSQPTEYQETCGDSHLLKEIFGSR